MPLLLFLSLLQAAPATAKDKLFPSPLIVPTAILEKAQEPGDARERYGEFRDLLEKEGLQVNFVLGKSDLKFLGIAPALWSSSYDYEDFSLSESFGRMLCKAHPRNKAKKQLLIVRADEPGDTLLHEYLHFLQSKRSAELCQLYSRLEKNPSKADLHNNLLAEYEVARFLRDEVKFSSNEIQLSLIDKLLKAAAKLTDGQRKRVDNLYGWAPLQPVPLSVEVSELFKVEAKLRMEMTDYKKSSIPASWGTPATPETAAKGSFSLLDPAPFSLSELPLCLKAGAVPPRELKIALEAAEKWNKSSVKLFNKAAFQTECGEAQVELYWEENAGKGADGVFKFGEVQVLKNKSVVLVRKKEWQQYGWMVSGLIRQALAQKPEKERKSAASELAAFQEGKEARALENFFLHELGHVLGLGHNFAEASLMNYSSEPAPTAYDEAALACRFQGKCDDAGKFQLSLKPRNNEAFTGD